MVDSVQRQELARERHHVIELGPNVVPASGMLVRTSTSSSSGTTRVKFPPWPQVEYASSSGTIQK